jgi:phosphomannomutase
VLDNKPFYGEELQNLRGVAEADDTDPAEGSVSEAAGLDRYVARVLDDAQLDRDLAVGWDAGNGAAGVAFAQLCGSLRGRHVRINEEVNDTFPAHHPDPTVAANLAQLQEVVLSEGLDVGFAFDGDGDRLGVIDETGRILWADQVLALLVPEVLTAHPGAPIIADVKCSQVLFDRILELGGDPIMWSTGHSLIKAKMLETGAPLAGEMSGHLFFADRYFGFDDALYAAVRLLNVLARDGRSLSALADELPATVSTPEIRVHCTDARKFEVVSAISDRLIARGADVVLIDGVRVRARGGWWLIRASNTEPALVVRCEAPDAGALSVLLGEVSESLEACGVVTGVALRPD